MSPVHTRSLTLIALTCLGSAPLHAVPQQSDWDLHSMRLVNRARQAPADEAGILGSAVTDASVPAPPLAYVASVATAARAHNDWMFHNLGAISSGGAPDSFTHYETWDGSSGGAAASSSTGFTGVTVGDRVTAAGFAWGAVAENIATAASTQVLPVDAAQVEANHLGWWESSGHRANMLNPLFTGYGHGLDSISASGPLGGLPAVFDNLHFATQNFVRPLAGPAHHVLGLLYRDLDGSGAWDPHDAGSPQREGLGGVTFEVYLSGASTQPVATGTTLAKGAFSVALNNGTYDVIFHGGAAAKTITVGGANVDAGDITDDALRVVVPTVSLATGGAQTLTLQAGAANAGRSYLVLGSVSGTSPGLPINGVVLPLAFDAYTNLTIALANSGTHQNTLGSLDAFGTATSSIHIPAGLSPTLAGLVLHHAYVVFQGAPGSPAVMASNAVSVTLTP